MEYLNAFTTYKISFSFKHIITDVLAGFVKPFMTGDASGHLLLSVIREPKRTVCFKKNCHCV